MDTALEDDPLERIRQTPEQATAHFRRILERMDQTQSGLAERMSKLGDQRPFPTILRGVQRMASGEARVSGEMQVIVELLSRERRRAIEAARRLIWRTDRDGIVSTSDRGFNVHLVPQTRNRWRVDVLNDKSGHGQQWPRWQDSLEEAKIRAMVSVEEAIDELLEPERS